MLQKPDLTDETIVSCLRDEYALSLAAITFLALGADADTAVYRVIADDPYSILPQAAATRCLRGIDRPGSPNPA